MSTPNRTHTLGILAVAALAGMGTPAGAQGRTQSDRSDRSYIFTYLILDAPEKLDQQQMQQAMQGHFENMGKLAEQGDLLIAGPLAEPRIDPSYRGIFVFSTDDIDQGKTLFNTDPSVQAGVFKPEMYTITCDEPLTDLLRLEKEDERRRLADPDIPDEWVGRSYILALGPAEARFELTDAVLIDATMERIGTEHDAPRQLLWLDATSIEDAKARFKAADLDEWSLYGWYGTPVIAQLNDTKPVITPSSP